MHTLWVSKKYSTSKLQKSTATIDDFIDVYENKINGWYINWAISLSKKRHGGFAALQIGFAYFESITIFKNGKENSSRKDFKESFKRIFETDFIDTSIRLETAMDFLYEEARCGFFHSGMTRKGILLEDGSPTFRITNIDISESGALKKIRIDRLSFFDRISTDFKNYINLLRNPENKDLRNNFKKSWNKIHFIELL